MERKQKYTAEECLALLRAKAEAISAAGEARYPKRSDFLPEEVCAVKAFFGPWGRALEAAGIKPPRDSDRAEKNRGKRIRAKRNRREAKKHNKEEEKP